MKNVRSVFRFLSVLTVQTGIFLSLHSEAAMTLDGWEPSAGYKGELSRNFAGGVQKGNFYLGLLDLKLGVDAEKSFGWKGGRFQLQVQGTHGGDPSAYVGDNQVTSNIEAPANTIKLYEAWLQQNLFEERVSLLVGLRDLNAEFYVTDSSGMFLNSSFGVGRDLSQSGANGPSIFPTTALASRVRVQVDSQFYLQSALFNGVAGDPNEPYGTHIGLGGDDGYLLISEAAYLVGSEADENSLLGKYGMGVWTYTSGASDTGVSNHGVYFLADQALGLGYSAFVRYGWATPQLNTVISNLSFGLVSEGLFAAREKDQLGLASTSVFETGGSVESTVELSYKFQFGSMVSLQPDLQLVVRPGFQGELNPAWIGSLRFEVAY